MVAPPLSLAQVQAFRLSRHNLDRRLPHESLKSTAVCGIQNTPPGAGVLSVHARIAGLKTGEVEKVLVEDRTLLQAWSFRSSPHIFPTRHSAQFTLALLPTREDWLRAVIPGAQVGLDNTGIPASTLVNIVKEGLKELLQGKELTKDQLGLELAAWTGQTLKGSEKAAWESASWVVRGQTTGESLIRFALPLAALAGVVCHAARREGKAFLALTEEWLGHPLQEASIQQAQAELVRSYLRCSAPTTPGELASWVGVGLEQALSLWSLVDEELYEVRWHSRPAWVLEEDLPGLQEPDVMQGVRFLPGHDPYLQVRDRESIVPNKFLHRYLWKSAGRPGLLLVNGLSAALWRSRKTGSRLKISIEPFVPLNQVHQAEIQSEAESLAPLQGCQEIELEYKFR